MIVVGLGCGRGVFSGVDYGGGGWGRLQEILWWWWVREEVGEGERCLRCWWVRVEAGEEEIMMVMDGGGGKVWRGGAHGESGSGNRQGSREEVMLAVGDSLLIPRGGGFVVAGGGPFSFGVEGG